VSTAQGLRRSAAGLLWTSPWLLGFAAFLVVPISLSAYYSLTDYALLDVPVWIGGDNYAELWSDPLFHRAMRNTFIFAVGNVVGGTALAVGAALLLEQRLRGAALVRAVVFVPTLVPVVAGCVSWLWMFNPRSGLLNSVLGAAGLAGPDWLGDRSWAMPSLVLMGWWVIGGPMLVCSAALKDVPRALYEAASLDGASALVRFRHVTLPLISPAVLFNAMMSLIWSLQMIAPPLIMTRGGPDNATLTSSMYVYKVGFEFGRMGYACALAWVQIAVTVMLACVVVGLGRRFVYYRAG
jgi:multiple sugar transport system permease protein